MKNRYSKYYREFNEECNDVVIIKADGSDRYGLNILINAKRLELVDQATSGYWRIVKENGHYYACTEDNLLYMHRLITGIDNPLIEEGFINGTKSTKLIPNPYLGQKVIRFIDDGLLNVDENLLVSTTCNVIPQITEDSYLEIRNTLKHQLTEENIYTTSFLSILNSQDSSIRTMAIEEFIKYVQSIKDIPLVKRGYIDIGNSIEVVDAYNKKLLTSESFIGENLSIDEMERRISTEGMCLESQYLFPGHLVIVYPTIKIIKSRKTHLCSFSGARISPGSEHLFYKLFIEDLTDSSVYYLENTLRAEIGYEDNFPTTIQQLDDFAYKLSHAYELDLDEYYNIVTNIGTDTLKLKKLHRK